MCRFGPSDGQQLYCKLDVCRAGRGTQRLRSTSFAIALLFMTSLSPRLLGLDDHNPIGVTGTFEGVITTGCAYNVVSHNATRQIDDIIVPGAIGKYGLKMTREQ